MAAISKEKKFIFIASIIFILDQLTKHIAAKEKVSMDIMEGLISLEYATNKGGGFGVLEGQMFILIFVSLAVLAAILYYLRMTPSNAVPFAALVFGGALGNLIDRIMFGYVVDFIDLSFWPTFNIADIGITIGIIGLIYIIWKS